MLQKAAKVDALVQAAPPGLLAKLRSIVAPPGKKGSWMKHLNDPQLLECYFRLERGEPAYKVAKIAIDQWGQMQDSTPRSLSRTVRAFKETALNALQLEKLNNPSAAEEITNLERRATKLSERFNVLEQLEKTIILQAERIDLIYSKEQKSVPFQFTHKELQAQASLLELYMKMSETLGVIPTTPRRLDVAVQHTFSKMVRDVGDSKDKLLASTTRFIELIEKESLNCEMGEDGKFKVVKKKDN